MKEEECHHQSILKKIILLLTYNGEPQNFSEAWSQLREEIGLKSWKKR